LDPSAIDNHAICTAASYGHAAIVDLLLQDERVVSFDNFADARFLAQKDGYTDVVNCLLQSNKTTKT
jgi:hypothetical protein